MNFLMSRNSISKIILFSLCALFSTAVIFYSLCHASDEVLESTNESPETPARSQTSQRSAINTVPLKETDKNGGVLPTDEGREKAYFSPPLFGAKLVSPPKPHTSAGAPVKGDMVVMGMLGEPSNLIPYLTSDAGSSEVQGNFYISLLKYDKNLEIVPFAAESFTVLDDGLRLRFILRKGIRWSDGVEMTADDVEFTYKFMTDPATPTAYGSDFRAVKEFKKVGKYEVEVIYDKPYPRSLNTWMGAILPKHALEGQDLKSSPLIRMPVSSGPYLLDEWQSGVHIKLRSNPDYFEGEPYISGLLYRFIPDATTMFLELRAGKIDILSALSAQQFLYQTQTPEFENKYDVWEWLSSTYTYMGYNLKSPLFSDVRVRRALAHAIDKKQIVQGALMGMGMSTIGPYKPGTWAYNDAIQDYSYDTALALELLGEAGWTQNRKGILEKDGSPFSFTLLVNQGNETRIKCAVFIQYQLKKIGIEVKIRIVDWSAFLAQFLEKGHFDAIILAWTIPLDPDGFDVWHSSKIGNGLNYISYGNAEVDSLLERARRTFDKKERKALYDRFQEILHEEQPYTFLFVPYSLAAVNRRFAGIDPAPAGIFHNMNKWWVPLNDQLYKLVP